LEKEQQELRNLISTAYNNVNEPKFNNFKQSLLKAAQELDSDGDYIKIMLGLRTALLQADLSLNIKTRISGLPTEYGDIYYFIEPQLKKVDSNTLDKYTHFGFIPLKFGNTIKYP